MDDDIVEQCHDTLEDFQLEHCGHDHVVDEHSVTFFGGWEASHEAWLFKQWLDDRDYTTSFGRTRHGSKDPRTVVVAQDVDVPDWVRAKLSGRENVVLFSMDKRVEVHRDDLDDGVEKLRAKLWKQLHENVSGIGEKTINRLAAEFETPMDGLGEFDEVKGVGSSTAEELDSYVEIWS